MYRSVGVLHAFVSLNMVIWYRDILEVRRSQVPFDESFGSSIPARDTVSGANRRLCRDLLNIAAVNEGLQQGRNLFSMRMNTSFAGVSILDVESSPHC